MNVVVQREDEMRANDLAGILDRSADNEELVGYMQLRGGDANEDNEQEFFQPPRRDVRSQRKC